MCEDCGCLFTDSSKENDEVHDHHGESNIQGMNPLLDEKKTLSILTNILDKNQKEADHIREHFNKRNIFAVNLMSSPGSGKTSLLEKTAEILKDRMAVLEGDLETNKDAERIKGKGVEAYQITTGQSCHLDAFMVHQGLHHLKSEGVEYIFVENVGNLVCPAVYDIGTHKNIVLISVPEGDDKAAKYPVMFKNADLVLISKYDLIDYFDFSVEGLKEDVKKLNPEAEILEVSVKDEKSIGRWIDYLKSERDNYLNSKETE